LGRSGTGATIYAGANEDSFTVLGDISASGRATISHVEALSGTTGPNIPKAFVSFWGNTGEKYTGYGISSIDREFAGKYKVNFSPDTKVLLENLGANDYHIQANMSLDTVDLSTPTIYSTVVDGGISNNDSVYIRCIKLQTGTPTFFDPRHVHVAIFKS